MPLPLEGLRILDSTTMIAMPYAMALMADMGAEVIKIDNHTSPPFPAAIHPDLTPGTKHWEWEGSHQTLHRNKLDISLNLKLPEAVSVFKDLVKVSDIVVENNRPGSMERLGLDYKTLKKIKPDLIYLSNTGFGHSGPWKSFPGIGRMMELTCGLSQFTGYHDEGPRRVGYAFFDPHVGWTSIFAILAALLYRHRTGKGQWIDLSMYQIGTACMGDAILDFIANQRNGKPMGNRHSYLAPHGVYPCKKDNTWIAITTLNESQWKSLCIEMGNPAWTKHKEFSDNYHRWSNQDKLDEFIGKWTKNFEDLELMNNLQAHGITAAAVLNSKQILLNPQVKDRGLFERVLHSPDSDLGEKLYIGRPWKMSLTPCSIRKPAPGMGEHNNYILKDILGRNEEELTRLYEIGALGTKPLDQKATVNNLPWKQQLDLGIIAGYDPDYKDVLNLKHNNRKEST